jgi:predicted nucleotidyltransferase
MFFIELRRPIMTNCLPKDKHHFVSAMCNALAGIPGIQAICLGGSYARGTATASSDIDIGIYYSEHCPPSIDAIRSLAKKFDPTVTTVTELYEWGPWVNGGAWLNTQNGKVDWLYRNLDQVNRVIEDALKGLFVWDFRQQPPYGFFSVTYLADLQHNIPLYDPKQIFVEFNNAIKVYPKPLKKSLIGEHLWSVEFSHLNAQKLADRGCIYGTVGCMTRIVSELTQVLFALNEVYFASEKEALKTIESFLAKPREYTNRINEILSYPGQGKALIQSLKKLGEIIRETIVLCKPLYTSKYSMK